MTPAVPGARWSTSWPKNGTLTMPPDCRRGSGVESCEKKTKIRPVTGVGCTVAGTTISTRGGFEAMNIGMGIYCREGLLRAMTSQKGQRDLATLNTLAQALSHSIDLGQVLRTALDTVAELLALDTGWVWLLDEAGAAPLAPSRNLPPGLVARPQLLEGSCSCLHTYRAGG